MTGDFVISLSRTTDDKSAAEEGDGTARIYAIKNRFGPDGLTFPCKFNTANGDLVMFREKSPEGQALLSQMEAASASEKENGHRNNVRAMAPGWKEHAKEYEQKQQTQPPVPPTKDNGIETE